MTIPDALSKAHGLLDEIFIASHGARNVAPFWVAAKAQSAKVLLDYASAEMAASTAPTLRDQLAMASMSTAWAMVSEGYCGDGGEESDGEKAVIVAYELADIALRVRQESPRGT